jgi:hypothetical protein
MVEACRYSAQCSANLEEWEKAISSTERTVRMKRQFLASELGKRKLYELKKMREEAGLKF